LHYGKPGVDMIKKAIFTLILCISASSVYAKVNAVVSILPQKSFVEAIGGDMVDVSLMVKPGNSPHTYEPKPSQMRDIAKADVYFAIDVEFERVWLHKFASTNKSMKIVDLDRGIKKMAISSHTHRHELHTHDTKDMHKGLDPHIWTSPANVKTIAKNIYNTLVQIDSTNKAYYKSNYDKYIAKIDTTDNKIKEILSTIPKESRFMVFHPAWGYFAHEYGLIQLAIEVDGKNPKPKQVVKIIKEAKKHNVRAVLTAPEFSQKVATQIAKELNIPVIKISPLNPKWSKNLINLANSIAGR
jgi:zinc transport system substrate-binding protein